MVECLAANSSSLSAHASSLLLSAINQFRKKLWKSRKWSQPLKNRIKENAVGLQFCDFFNVGPNFIPKKFKL
jgi:hypothetical protein